MKPEPFNKDSLLITDKEETNKRVLPEPKNTNSEKELLQLGTPKREVQLKSSIIKLQDGSRMLGDNNIVVKHDLPLKEKKVKSLTIKSKHQEARDDKSSKILLPMLKVNNNNSCL